MSKEHDVIVVRIKCVNKICEKEHSAILQKHKALTKKIQCPCCGWMTKQKDVNILEYYKPVKFTA